MFKPVPPHTPVYLRRYKKGEILALATRNSDANTNIKAPRNLLVDLDAEDAHDKASKLQGKPLNSLTHYSNH